MLATALLALAATPPNAKAAAKLNKTGIIALTGFMGSGKTTAGRALSLAAGVLFIDLDEYIEERTGKTVPELFAAVGEDGFRAEESKALGEVLDEYRGRDLVLALGGGTLLSPDNLAKVKSSCRTIYLKVNPETLETRLSGSEAGRPLLYGRSVRELLEKRLGLYEKAADITLNADTLSPEDLASSITGLISPDIKRKFDEHNAENRP